jgi:hypothetical protein
VPEFKGINKPHVENDRYYIQILVKSLPTEYTVVYKFPPHPHPLVVYIPHRLVVGVGPRALLVVSVVDRPVDLALLPLAAERVAVGHEHGARPVLRCEDEEKGEGKL